jgi:hypothetical protein
VPRIRSRHRAADKGNAQQGRQERQYRRNEQHTSQRRVQHRYEIVIAASDRIQPERAPAECHHRRRKMDEAAGDECLNHRSASRPDLELERILCGMRVHRDDVPSDPVPTGSKARHSEDKLCLVAAIYRRGAGLDRLALGRGQSPPVRKPVRSLE